MFNIKYPINIYSKAETNTQKSAYNCKHITHRTQTHIYVLNTVAHTLPIAQKPFYVFMALLSERVCLGELLLLPSADFFVFMCV